MKQPVMDFPGQINMRRLYYIIKGKIYGPFYNKLNDDIVKDYLTGKFTTKELAIKYNVNRINTINCAISVIPKELRDQLRLQHIREKTIESRKQGKCTGKNHWNWQGGINDPSQRGHPKYWKWRNNVIKRDGRICQLCHIKFPTNELEAHHIAAWKIYPKKRYNLDNGITLCAACHNFVEYTHMVAFQ